MLGCSGFQLDLRANRNLGIKRLLQVSVESFFRIKLRTVAGQIEQLDLVFPFRNPSLDRFAVMNTQVVDDNPRDRGFLLEVLADFSPLVTASG